MSAVSDILTVVQVLREHGVLVTFEPGWETRGNGQWTDFYEGSVIHHTGTPSASYANPAPTTRLLRDGRSDLSGPLCNGQVRFDGSAHIIAANPANHAGASGGPSMGPLPVTRLFNPRVMGWEIDYGGNTPMSPEQYRTAQVIAIATARLRGRPSLEWTRAHAETSIEGKWDPGYAPGKTINMGVFRADAPNVIQEGDDMPFGVPNPVQWEPGTEKWGVLAVPPVGGSLSVGGSGEAWVHLRCPNRPVKVLGMWLVHYNGTLLEEVPEFELKHDSYWVKQLPKGCSQVSVKYTGEVPIGATLETRA